MNSLTPYEQESFVESVIDSYITHIITNIIPTKLKIADNMHDMTKAYKMKIIDEINIPNAYIVDKMLEGLAKYVKDRKHIVMEPIEIMRYYMISIARAAKRSTHDRGMHDIFAAIFKIGFGRALTRISNNSDLLQRILNNDSRSVAEVMDIIHNEFKSAKDNNISIVAGGSYTIERLNSNNEIMRLQQQNEILKKQMNDLKSTKQTNNDKLKELIVRYERKINSQKNEIKILKDKYKKLKSEKSTSDEHIINIVNDAIQRTTEIKSVEHIPDIQEPSILQENNFGKQNFPEHEKTTEIPSDTENTEDEEEEYEEDEQSNIAVL